MPKSQRPFQSLVLALVLVLGGIVTFAAGAGYMNGSDVSEYVAALDIVAGAMLFAGGICCLSGRSALWKALFASVIAETAAAIGMLTVTVAGGIVLILICAGLMWWIHTAPIRRWFGV